MLEERLKERCNEFIEQIETFCENLLKTGQYTVSELQELVQPILEFYVSYLEGEIEYE